MDAERARLERVRLERARRDRGYPRLRVEKRRRSGLGQRIAAAILIIGFLGAAGTAAAISRNAFGAGDLYERLVAKIERFLAGPPPDRPTVPTVTVTPKPSRPAPSVDPTASEDPAAPTPTPVPRVPVDVDILANPKAVFAHEIDKDWCAPAGVTMVLAATGNGAPTDARQREIASRVREWESWADSHNGLWGPAAMSLALAEYGAPGYEIHAYETRAEALHGAAVAISTTKSPAVLLAWRGAHTWVMSGYRANADPLVFEDAKVSGAYILDPWYPWTSNIWGKSDPPGAFQDAAEMNRNFLPWKRPEGKYPDRDGKFIVLIPTVPIG
ncbi:MAG TPA: hypothetical protein VFK35_02625 [Candidatus Limnocylindrales bacterium]|nr:hypothetical protein [Candidatus Limnocylindrales bacterium]